MHSTTDAYGAVTVIVPSGSMSRYVTFELDLEALNVTKKSMLGRARGASVAKNRNQPVRLSKTPYYLFIDDDHRFSEELLLNLLRHDKPVVSALICSKMPPFIPIVFKSQEPTDDGHVQFQPYSWKDLDGKKGLFGPVHALGGGCLLVKRQVFEVIPPPWFELGHYDSEECQEDLYFSEKCRNHGIEMHVDLSTRVGHISPVAAVPRQFPDGTWTIALEFENDESAMLARTDIQRRPDVLPAR